MDDRSILETIGDSFRNLLESAVEYTPRILAALLLLIIGFIVARIISKLMGRFINAIEENATVKNVAKKLDITVVNISDLVAMLTRWAVLLIFVIAAIDALGVAVLTDTFNEILAFLPNIFAAALILAVSILMGNVVFNIVRESAKKAKIKSHAFLAGAARVAVLVFGIPLALAQLGLDLTIINNNITVVVAGIMLALAVAFGLGAKDTAGKIVDDIYKNWKK